MFKKLEQVTFDTRDNKSIFSLIFFDYIKHIPNRFRAAARRQVNESPGA
ncbi:hypothetical protein BDD30_4478 [Photorhabdus asymbiotica]|uniref:Uncharacterized protein n=1 Tax=Photorhabdus asymbiotica TaxID=291112 RepID=A0ABX9SG40_9GAMM|nr:hypothetical protein BDD30_4478 [Photorhabdus asymbiotica]